MKEILISLAVIIGTIIGAGFASGREILNFFNIYGENGALGIILVNILFGIIIFLVINIITEKNISQYNELINSNKILSKILKIFSAVCFCIMIAGVGAFAYEQLNISFWIGTAFASTVSYAMFLHKFEGLEVFNCILVPLIILGILIIGMSDYSNLNINISEEIVFKMEYRKEFYSSCNALCKL